jgi:hypothetical protein
MALVEGGEKAVKCEFRSAGLREMGGKSGFLQTPGRTVTPFRYNERGLQYLRQAVS